jgi:hypothetical protein
LEWLQRRAGPACRFAVAVARPFMTKATLRRDCGRIVPEPDWPSLPQSDICGGFFWLLGPLPKIIFTQLLSDGCLLKLFKRIN